MADKGSSGLPKDALQMARLLESMVRGRRAAAAAAAMH